MKTSPLSIRHRAFLVWTVSALTVLSGLGLPNLAAAAEVLTSVSGRFLVAGVPVADARVGLSCGGSTVYGYADAGGRFGFAEVVVGSRCEVSFRPADGSELRFSAYGEIQVGDGLVMPDVDVPRWDVTVQVVGVDGSALPGAAVTLAGGYEPQLVFPGFVANVSGRSVWGTTDSSGSVQLPSWGAAETRQLLIESPGGDGVWDFDEDVAIADGATVRVELKDRTAPTIEITSLVEGAQVSRGGELLVEYQCTDSGDLRSGVVSCEGTVPSGSSVDTSQLGSQQFTVVAVDAAGNRSTKSVGYEVLTSVSGRFLVAGVPVADIRVGLQCDGPTAHAYTDSEGRYTFGEVVPGSSCDVSFKAADGTVNRFAVWGAVEVGDGLVMSDVDVPRMDVTVQVVGVDGSALPGASVYFGTGYQSEIALPDFLASVRGYATGGTTDAAGSVQLPVWGAADVVRLLIESPGGDGTFNFHEEVSVADGATLVVIRGEDGSLRLAEPDGDGVSPSVELQVPSLGGTGTGDGNGDGLADAQQTNVASLPAATGSGAAYVTVAAAAGTELSAVVTMDPSDTSKVSTPPPAGVGLPEGLTSFVLGGIEPGSDQIISFFTSSTADVTGYAKYDTASSAWSMLPSDRVQVVDEHRVDVRLTDGGEGDADGLVNGSIDDPGGLAIILDTDAPVVSGSVGATPNAAGWHRGDVTVTWTAVDAEPSSGGVSDPPATTVSGEGADLAAESAPVCDIAGNCGTGRVEGINIDRTGPIVAVTGVEEDKSYTLGAVPVASCTAIDSLSGLDGSCMGELAGGNANGVGEFSYTATARDHAGNATTEIVTFRVVYRFDGFEQPINDPNLVPGSSRSVFKARSTVPVKFQVKRADGTIVPDVSTPLWVTPQKGAPSSEAPNEQVWDEQASSGTAFELTGDRWHYNWKTTGFAAGFTYRLGVRLDDGTTHTVVVALK